MRPVGLTSVGGAGIEVEIGGAGVEEDDLELGWCTDSNCEGVISYLSNLQDVYSTHCWHSRHHR